MLPFEAIGIIGRVHEDELRREAERLEQEREARRVLRLQAGNPAVLTSSDLLRKLAGEDETESKDNEPLRVSTEEAHHAPATQSAFPPPPTGPGQTSKEG